MAVYEGRSRLAGTLAADPLPNGKTARQTIPVHLGRNDEMENN
jgi:hypothetical protein